MKKIIFPILAAAAIFTSCKKDTATTSEYDTNKKGELSVEFDNIVGSSDLQLNTGSYTNSSNETYTVTTLKYFVSNFVLTRVDGTVYTVPQDSCYFLIDESDSSTHEPIVKIPEGEYKTLSFGLGVDSLRNTMDASMRTGNLDPTGIASGMYWSWNSGYINFKVEGTSPAAGMMGSYMYHIGGFGGKTSSTANNYRTITLDLTARGTAKVKASKTEPTNIHLMVDVNKLFTGASTIKIADAAMVMDISGGVKFANNYANMFAHDHTEN